MRTRISWVLTAVVLAVSSHAGAQSINGCGGGSGLQVVGLTDDQRLICFRENNAGQARTIGRISGLTGDGELVGIDYRPATGELWGLGDEGGLYVIDTRDGDATFKSQLNVDLTGDSFGVDFNPTVDRLRVISDSGQNLRINVDTGAVTTDTALAYPPDGATGVTGAAYTNNDAKANTGTTLYVIDSRLDQVTIQAPPNNGSLNAVGKLTLDASSDVGFDIYSRLDGGSTVDVHAFASLLSGDRARFYKVNLFTGRAWMRGNFKAQDRVIDIAIPTRQR